MTDLIKDEQFLSIDNSMFGSKSNTDKIITRAVDEKVFELKTLNEVSLTKIADFMPEVNRATNAFGKTQSQFMNNIMTISSFGVYRNLRQVMSEIERRRSALKENVFKNKKSLLIQSFKYFLDDYMTGVENYLKNAGEDITARELIKLIGAISLGSKIVPRANKAVSPEDAGRLIMQLYSKVTVPSDIWTPALSRPFTIILFLTVTLSLSLMLRLHPSSSLELPTIVLPTTVELDAPCKSTPQLL